ncbi:lycopene cyclase family protein [Streptomyces phyllanthi]|uniref:Lycopene cyclase n=1 Tax=Streptomyces phyllanthi TaxID=1803180 RepID=A0A5N8VTU1_9ACTN|nr:lycopene cyclase family protein [Streptomyces phyllanthi]MPY38657.1 lycopene cyclase [Streptomyces phyllanthi]
MKDADIVVVGAGAAGLSLADRLTRPDMPRPGPSVLLVTAPPGPARPAERTWCFWERTGGDYDDAVVASWERLRVRAPDGTVVEATPAPLRYKMIRSPGFEELLRERLSARPGFRGTEATVQEVRDVPGGAEVRCTTADGAALTLRARWVFDSRPPRRLPPARTVLLQHFRGWFLRTERPAFDPDAAELMDFRTPQPARGLSFGYVLPLGTREALVEYTEFAPEVIGDAAYDRLLGRYVRDVLGIGAARVVAAEQGVIPMTDAVFPRRAGASVFRIGAAGGATRPATGYTFSAVRRQAAAIADACRAGRTPVPPPAHGARARAMDAVMLRALATGRIDGPRFFVELFRHCPAELVLRFLDGESRLLEDLALGLRTPVLPMLRTAAELPLLARRENPSCPFPAPVSLPVPTEEERP